ncbi:histone deacetylase complex protein [Laetiporus sulphureus 93-53]|uniref:histone deacetylase n=1 Tax=Laetiporus sulphureus 93-53 TaxID=1314785 RepID=A0A165GZQ2_9APHY|nr:histone deacetylase complex protein [Laetiporus sulphureus 93-53]KZT11050.1 histone deacetylase complex protein [Laetiporus sulphureus 93-53]
MEAEHVEVAVQMEVDSEGPVASSAPPPPNPPTEPVARAASLPPILAPSQAQVGYVYSSKMMMHSCSRGHHEEQPERISRIFDILKDAGCTRKMRRLPIRQVIRSEALLVHSEALWEKVMAIQSMTDQDIADSAAYYDELSLYVHKSTPYAARLSAGGVIEAALAVARGDVKKAFAIVRPPGHHAEPDEHMGFCFFNNVSIASKVVQLRTSVKKIMILDWDIHHGNGTQRTFYDDPSVLYISLHRYEGGHFYPNGPFGNLTSCGQGDGLGYTVNIPWPEKDMGDADYLHAFQKVIMPIAVEFAPDLVIISSGFDAAEGDTLGECHVSPTGYAHMTHMLSALANGKLVVALEGGYSLDAISVSALAVAKVLLGEAPPQIESMVASEVATETIWQVAMEQSKYWKNVDPKACEPIEEIEPITFSMSELLKAHRQDYLFRTHSMVQVPLIPKALEEQFGSQVACTPDIMDNDVLVVFVHEFGNLRAELDSVIYCDVNQEHSYLVDCSKQVIAWVTSAGYALLDVNVFAKPFTKSKTRHADDPTADIMTYLWDNYIQLTEARRIMLIGHGPGCEALMALMRQRPVNVMKSVRAVVQVVGNYSVPVTPGDIDSLRTWYYKNSLIFIPKDHDILHDKKIMKKHGSVMLSELTRQAEETKPIKLIIQALPVIKDFVSQRLASAPVTNGDS